MTTNTPGHLDPQPVPPDCSILLFDGDCNLCSVGVRFIIARDRGKRFRFASLQSATGRRLLEQHGLRGDRQDSMVLLEGQRAFTRSAAALRIFRRLRWPWPLLLTLVVVPRFVRDFLYALIARTRHRWFRGSASCRLPSPELRERFLDDAGPLP